MKPVIEFARRARGRADATIVFAYDDRALPEGLDRAGVALLRRRRFRGGPAELVAVPTDSGTTIVAGLGKRADLDAATLHRAAAAAARAAQQERAATVHVALPAGDAPLDAAARCQHVALGLLLGAYRFERFVTDAERRAHQPERFVLTSEEPLAKADALLARAQAIAESTALVRDLVNLPAGHLSPEVFAGEARRALRGTGVTVTVLGPRELLREKMGALLAVARGSDNPPRLVHLAYKPKGRAKARVAFVGKGVTFDSGGYDIKPVDAMDTMKCDMAGAAAVLGAVRALARIGAPVEVHGILGLVENMISGNAYRPGDVLTSRKGTTIEINNTDAEGRLVLADALDYARTKVGPDAVIDLATLTGACLVALGPNCAGLFSNRDELAARLLDAGRRAGEQAWRLPLLADLQDQMKSDIADTKNTGSRWGGAITAGLFLQGFVDARMPWAHLDIAGPAYLAAEHPFWGKGGTGYGVGTLVEYALGL